MDNKTQRALELLTALQASGWTDAQFWEAHQLLRSTPDSAMSEPLVALLMVWGDIESDRIACGEHDAPSAAMEAWLAEMWPIRCNAQA